MKPFHRMKTGTVFSKEFSNPSFAQAQRAMLSKFLSVASLHLHYRAQL